MSPADIERAANAAAAIAATDTGITDTAAFVAGYVSGRLHVVADPRTPDEIVTPDVLLLRSADGWYSKSLTAEPSLLSVGSALIVGAR